MEMLRGSGTRIFIGLMLLVVIGAAVFYFFLQAPNDVVNSQLLALRQHDYAKAYHFTSSDFQQGTSIDQFTAFIEQYPILKDNKTITFNETKTEGTIGYISGTLEDQEGNIATIEFQLAKENHHWMIQAVRLSDFIQK